MGLELSASDNRKVFKAVVVSIVLIVAYFLSVSDPLPPRYIATLAQVSGQGIPEHFFSLLLREGGRGAT